MDLPKLNRYLQSSSKRLNSAMELYEKAGAAHILAFLRKEAWINLKRSWNLWWALRRARPESK